jgi:cholest-4-en-3-one 26-monooxygenase
MFQFLGASIGRFAVSAADIPPGIDLTDPELYAHRVPDQEFAELRRAEPIR